MANNLPYYSMYPKDFDSNEAVRMMNFAERGLYITLLNHSWVNDGIPAEADKIRRLVQATPEEFAAMWPAVETEFPISEDGRRRQGRQEKERAVAKKKVERIRKAQEAKLSVVNEHVNDIVNEVVNEHVNAGHASDSDSEYESGVQCSGERVQGEGAEIAPDQLPKVLLGRYKRAKGTHLDSRKQDKQRTTAWLEQHEDPPDVILAALEQFLADPYWASAKYPLAAFRKQYADYRDRATGIPPPDRPTTFPTVPNAAPNTPPDAPQSALVPVADTIPKFLDHCGNSCFSEIYVLYVQRTKHGPSLTLTEVQDFWAQFAALSDDQQRGSVENARVSFNEYALGWRKWLAKKPWTAANVPPAKPPERDRVMEILLERQARRQAKIAAEGYCPW